VKLSKKIALPLYSITLILFALSPFYILDKYLNTQQKILNTGSVLGDTSCSCDCGGSPGSYTDVYCGAKGSAGYQEISGTCYEIQGHCNADASDDGSSCNANHYYTTQGSSVDSSNCGSGGGGGGDTCNISSCADAGGKVCNFGVPTSCSGMNQSLCSTHAGSDCFWTGSSCTCDPNQGNTGGEGDCGFNITYSDSHACSGGNSASLTATITKKDPSKCTQALDVDINAGSFSCPGEDYADGTCRTCGGGSGKTTVTIPANEASKTHSVSCQVENNCGSCQVDINGTGTLVYDNSGCGPVVTPGPQPTYYDIGGKAYCVIKSTGQKEYKGGIDISLGGTKIATTDGSGSWAASKEASTLINTYIRPTGGSNFPNASATDQSTGVNNGINCTDSNVEGATRRTEGVVESVGCKRTIPTNEINFNLGYCPIPDCTSIQGPKDLIVGQPATYNVSFSKSVPNAKVTGVGISIIDGSINAGTQVCSSDNQPGRYIVQDANNNTSINSFSWTPKATGTFSIYGRIWNDGITECKAACVDGPPRYECQSATSCRTEVTVKNPEVPVPNFSCDDLLMSFENASGAVEYNETSPNIPKGYTGNIILTCKASSASTTKIDKIKFQLSLNGAIVKQADNTDVKEVTVSGENKRKFEATQKFAVNSKGKYEADSMACITFEGNEYCN